MMAQPANARVSVRLVATVALAVLVAGCGKQTPVATNVGAQVSNAEARQFAQKLSQAVKAGDYATTSDLFDLEAMTDTAAAGLDIRGPSLKGFIRGLRRGGSSREGFGGQIVAQVSNGGSYELLRVLDREGKKTARMRLLLANDGGLNYTDLMLARRADGKIRAVDFYNHASGELMSETLRRAVVQFAASENSGILARLTGAENDYVKNASRLKEISRAVIEGRGRDALSMCDSLPESMRKDKTIIIARVRAASDLDEPTYMAAMEEFRNAFPNDPALDIMSIDYYFVRKEYDKTLEMIDRLDKAVGGDAYLDLFRANMLLVAGRVAAAKAPAQRYSRATPEKSDGPMTQLSISLAQKDHSETLRLMNLLEQKFGMEWNDPKTVPEYAAFARSPQYREWLKAHPQH
jgi:hypothetical protein